MMQNLKYSGREPSTAIMGAPSLAEIISALSFALDLTEGAVPGHALRSCLIGMRIATELRFSSRMMTDLYHALLLKDVGCSSNSARMCAIIGGGDDRAVKAGVKLEDWTRMNRPSLSTLKFFWHTVMPGANPIRRLAGIARIGASQAKHNEEMIGLRCDRGASIVRKIGLSEQSALAVRSLDEHWDGSGYPQQLKGNAISPLSRVMAVAQHLDMFAHERGVAQAMFVLAERSGRWFDPCMVRAAESLHRRGALWHQCVPETGLSATALEQQSRAAVLDQAPDESARMSPAHIDLICEAFSEVVDAKSPFTFRHSMGVTQAAKLIGSQMGLGEDKIQLLHRAALLHDLGKLRVPNSILDKPGKLDAAERAVMQEHSGLTREILARIPQYHELAVVAGAHHEKLDGSGYPDRMRAEELPLEARILAVADVYGALTEDRPYRGGFSIEKAIDIMKADVPYKLDGECFEALLAAVKMPAAMTPAEAEGVACSPLPAVFAAPLQISPAPAAQL